MNSWKRKKITLMPAVSLAALSGLIAIPALSQARLYAASPEHAVAVTVRQGDNLWSIADRYTKADASTQDTVDRIIAANHLPDATIRVGERLTVPR